MKYKSDRDNTWKLIVRPLLQPRDFTVVAFLHLHANKSVPPTPPVGHPWSSVAPPYHHLPLPETSIPWSSSLPTPHWQTLALTQHWGATTTTSANLLLDAPAATSHYPPPPLSLHHRCLFSAFGRHSYPESEILIAISSDRAWSRAHLMTWPCTWYIYQYTPSLLKLLLPFTF
jgi:hypothetical protein